MTCEPAEVARFPLPDKYRQPTVAPAGDRLLALGGWNLLTVLDMQPNAKPRNVTTTVPPRPFVAFATKPKGLKLAWTGPDHKGLVGGVNLLTAPRRWCQRSRCPG